MNCYEFGCLIDCPCDECIKGDCKYYGDCASCRWFWECPDFLSDCEFEHKKVVQNAEIK